MNSPRVLLVDDEQSMLLTLGAVLELEGMTVATAENGQHALALVKQQPFDLVLTDVRMPGMNGVELFREIRKLSPGLPVILMTAFALESLLDEAIQEGAFAVLSKPFAIEQLLPVLFSATQRPMVLIIDADRGTAQNSANSLQAVGIHARAVFDEESALRAIADETIDVCVIELAMAAHGDPALISRLKAQDPALTFIALSGHDLPELLRKLTPNTAMTWLRKPVKSHSLTQSIANARGIRVVRK